MVIDDQVDNLKLIYSALKKYGHNVDMFADPADALRHFQKNCENYSLMLVDIRMPGMNGLDFAKHAQLIYPHV